MGHRELIAALRAAGKAEVEELATETTMAVAVLRQQSATELARLADESRAAASMAQATARLEQECAARRRCQELRRQVETAFAERLLAVALAELPRLAMAAGPALFTRLAAELPAVPWRQVTVNPRDAAAAAEQFPTATVVTSPSLAGGLIAVSNDAALMVDNSLETRLRLAWPDLLSQLLAEFFPEE